MKVSRRQFVVSTLGVIAGGCSQHVTLTSLMPSPAWPGSDASPDITPPPPPPRASNVIHRPYQPPPPRPAPGLPIIARANWTHDLPDYTDINAMAGVGRITVHHTGWDPIYFDTYDQTRTHLEKIRKYHVDDRRWADIGYHYIIDRAGRIWQARPTQFQGAHVKGQNEHNLGIMVLGNFDRQSPTAQQDQSLTQSLTYFKRLYRVPVRHVYTHQELNKTECPGTRMQRRMVSLRRDGHLA